MKGYLANGLFSIGDKIVNDVVAREVRNRYYIMHGEESELDLYLPQENKDINDKTGFASSVDIAKADADKLMDSDFMIAIIDGVEIDAGVACEIGMFSATGKPIYALYSDIRQQGRSHPDKLQALMDDATENQFMYRNLFVIGTIKNSGGGICSSIFELANAVVKAD